MNEVFQIAPLNPIRFINLSENLGWPEIYHSKPFDLEFFRESIFDFQTHVCFFQKYQTNDTAKIQVWSDFGIDKITLYNYDTGISYDLPFTDTGQTFTDFTFSVYEFELLFGNYGQGKCYIDLIYTDGAGAEVVYQSDPIWIKEEWENTLLIEYKNDENAFSIIFATGIVFNLRVDGILDNFQPKSERLTYADQVRNQTLLYGVPYREFRLNIGGPEGIPDWMADKITRILDCNEVKIDGEYYVVAEGTDVEINRNEVYPLVGYRININQVSNRFNQRLKTGNGQGGGSYQMVLKTVNRSDVAGDQIYSGMIRKYSVLHALAIVKTSANPIILLVGTTDGGSEISGSGGFEITDDSSFIEINWLFDTPSNVYLSGLAGSTSDINFYYYDPLDTSSGGGGGSNAPATFVKGTLYVYFEIAAGDYATHWDSVTGLGIIGTPYEGCALADGRNGTPNMQGRIVMGAGDYTDASGSYTYTRKQLVGIAKHPLVEAELAPHQHTKATIAQGEYGLMRRSKTGEGNTPDTTDSASSGQQPDITATPAPIPVAGQGTPHENRQPSIALTYFLRII